MPTVLLVDDEEGFRYSFRRVFAFDPADVEHAEQGREIVTAATVAEGIQLFQARAPDVVVLDLQLPDGSGMDVFASIQAVSPKRPVIFITAHGTTQTAIEAMKRGAFEYLVKPVDFDRLSEILNRALEAARLMQVPALLPTLEPAETIVGHSPAIQEVCKIIGRVAPQDVNVLILGESGTGKELVARALYHHSRRANRPFLAINCAALPENLVESELFGHERGAFTGADRQRIGKFEQCGDGTILLDEIGDLSPTAQAKILRLLQEQQFERVGGHETIRTQVRILAATNQDLEKRIAEGRFRADLYYRLRGVTIIIPPLRERAGDIAELAHHFLFAYNRELELNVQGLDPEALACLQQYRWPGNVRELQSVIREAMLRATGPLLLPEFLPVSVQRTPAPVRPGLETSGEATGSIDLAVLIENLLQRGELHLYARVIEVVERALFARVLRETHGHQGQASERLGLNRSTLRYKLRELGLSVDRVVGGTGEKAAPHEADSEPGHL
jgi:two-component system nitrogen regulation response regulator GlnG